MNRYIASQKTPEWSNHTLKAATLKNFKKIPFCFLYFIKASRLLLFKLPYIKIYIIGRRRASFQKFLLYFHQLEFQFPDGVEGNGVALYQTKIHVKILFCFLPSKLDFDSHYAHNRLTPPYVQVQTEIFYTIELYKASHLYIHNFSQKMLRVGEKLSHTEFIYIVDQKMLWSGGYESYAWFMKVTINEDMEA